MTLTMERCRKIQVKSVISIISQSESLNGYEKRNGYARLFIIILFVTIAQQKGFLRNFLHNFKYSTHSQPRKQLHHNFPSDFECSFSCRWIFSHFLELHGFCIGKHTLAITRSYSRKYASNVFRVDTISTRFAKAKQTRSETAADLSIMKSRKTENWSKSLANFSIKYQTRSYRKSRWKAWNVSSSSSFCTDDDDKLTKRSIQRPWPDFRGGETMKTIAKATEQVSK